VNSDSNNTDSEELSKSKEPPIWITAVGLFAFALLLIIASSCDYYTEVSGIENACILEIVVDEPMTTFYELYLQHHTGWGKSISYSVWLRRFHELNPDCGFGYYTKGTRLKVPSLLYEY